MDRIVSKTISNMRFPLAVMVIYIHYFGTKISNENELLSSNFNIDELYNIIRVYISYGICQIAVPTFFLISGFLFYQHLQEWNWNVWKGKILRRVHTLVIPYLIWNIIRYLFNIITTGYHVYHHEGFQAVCLWLKENTQPLMFWVMYGPTYPAPIHVPFWFIRDLIVMVVLTPFFYPLIKNKAVRRCLLGLLLVCYLLNLIPPMPGISIESLLFFNLGGAISLANISICTTNKLVDSFVCIIFYILLPIILVITVSFYPQQNVYSHVKPLFVLIMMAITIRSTIIYTRKGFNIPKQLGDSSFFVYAFHMFILISLDIISSTLHFFYSSIWFKIMLYLFIPLLTAIACYYIYKLLNKQFPHVCDFLTGRKN